MDITSDGPGARGGQAEDVFARQQRLDRFEALPQQRGDDLVRAGRFARDLDFGTVWVNEHMPLSPELPHGGFGQSGYGKEGSPLALEECTRVKHVMIDLEGEPEKDWHDDIAVLREMPASQSDDHEGFQDLPGSAVSSSTPAIDPSAHEAHVSSGGGHGR